MKAHIIQCNSAFLEDLKVEPQAEVLPHCLSIFMSNTESVEPGSHQDLGCCPGPASPTFPICRGLLLCEVWLPVSPLLQTIDRLEKSGILLTEEN